MLIPKLIASTIRSNRREGSCRRRAKEIRRMVTGVKAYNCQVKCLLWRETEKRTFSIWIKLTER